MQPAALEERTTSAHTQVNELALTRYSGFPKCVAPSPFSELSSELSSELFSELFF